MAGKKAKCPKCQNVFVLPGAADAVTTAPPAVAAAPSRPARSREDDDMAFENDRPARGGRGSEDDFDAPRRTGGTNGLAIAGMVLGIVGLVLAFIPCVGWILGIILGIVDAALSGIGLASANKSGSGKGMAVSGLILSILAIVVAISYWIYVAFVINTAANQLNNIQINDKKVNFNDAFKDAFKDAGKINFNNNNHPPVPGNAKAVAVGNINPLERKPFQISFTQGQKAEIWVKSEMEGDVDLFVKDKNGANVAADGALSKDAYVTFIANSNEPYTVEVVNSAGPNRCTLHHTGK